MFVTRRYSDYTYVCVLKRKWVCNQIVNVLYTNYILCFAGVSGICISLNEFDPLPGDPSWGQLFEPTALHPPPACVIQRSLDPAPYPGAELWGTVVCIAWDRPLSVIKYSVRNLFYFFYMIGVFCFNMNLGFSDCISKQFESNNVLQAIHRTRIMPC